MAIIRAKNNKVAADTWVGQVIQPGAYYTIAESEEFAWSHDDKVLTDIAAGDLTIATSDADIVGVSDQISYLKDDSPQDVITLYEKGDKIPRYASVAGDYDVNGDITLSIKIPGAFSAIPTRYMALAYFVSDVFGWGDKVTKVEITDEDNILGAGAGYVVDSLHDIDAPSANQGWYFYPAQGGSGELEVTPLDKFGELNGGLYLKATLKRAVGSAATKVFVNVDWGAKTS